MRRRERPEHDPAEAARLAKEGRWWSLRAQQDTALGPAEKARYAALRDCGDAHASIDAILATSTAAAAVAGSLSHRTADR